MSIVLLVCGLAVANFGTLYAWAHNPPAANAQASAGRCSITPEPDDSGSFYGVQQEFTLRAVARGMAPIATRLVVSIEPGGMFEASLSGSAWLSTLTWQTENRAGLGNPDILVPLPAPLPGGWQVDIQPNVYAPSGYVTAVTQNC